MRFKHLVPIILLLLTSLHARAGFFEPWGNDSGLKHQPLTQEAPQKTSLAVKIADLVIKFHQEVLSPVDGPRSHFRPSSSQYMQQAIHRYGFIKGYLMGCDRLLRENDEQWVYRKIQFGDRILKYDPAQEDKYY